MTQYKSEKASENQHRLSAKFIQVQLTDGTTEWMPQTTSLIPTVSGQYESLEAQRKEASSHRKNFSVPFDDLDHFMKEHKYVPAVQWYGTIYENKYHKRPKEWKLQQEIDSESAKVEEKKTSLNSKIINLMKDKNL